MLNTQGVRLMIMTVQNIASIALLVPMIVMVRFRAAVLRKRGVRAIVFGKTDKSDFLLVPCVLAIVYSALAIHRQVLR